MLIFKTEKEKVCHFCTNKFNNNYNKSTEPKVTSFTQGCQRLLMHDYQISK